MVDHRHGQWERRATSGGSNGSAADPLVGQTVGADFVVRRVLAGGSESVAYLAEQTSLGDREVVVKVIRELVLRLTARENRREANPFLKEIRLANIVRHPAFPQIYSAGRLGDGRPYIVLEYVRGRTLPETLRESGPLPLSSVRRLGGELCQALRALHENNVVYRDLKPDHMLLEPSVGGTFRLRLLDLGHAQTTYQTDLKSRHGEGEFIGTPGYLSPELAEGKRVDERSDIFTAGLVIYEMLTGFPAIHIESATSENLVGYLGTEAPIPTHPLPEVRPDLPAALCAVVGRATDRRARARFATTRELEAAFLAAFDGAPPDDVPTPTHRDRLRRAFGR